MDTANCPAPSNMPNLGQRVFLPPAVSEAAVPRSCVPQKLLPALHLYYQVASSDATAPQRPEAKVSKTSVACDASSL